MRVQHLRIVLTSTAALALAACGGGGGVARVESTPPPPVSPTATAVTIFASPHPTTYASVGVATTVTGSYTANESIGPISSADSDQVHIRYTNGGYYEIQMPGAAYEPLTIAKGASPQDPATFNYFQPQSAPQNGASLITQVARLQGYQYSELAAWLDPSKNRVGDVAFGTATLAGQMPVTGSASYHGIVRGSSDVVTYDPFDGYYRAPTGGSVDLNFDFGLGSLSGAMTLNLDDHTATQLGTFAFKDTVFSVGRTSYSGRFDTATAGQNFFLGQFTGPSAEETIGAWALPFVYSGDGTTHQAFGAWIAKHP